MNENCHATSVPSRCAAPVRGFASCLQAICLAAVLLLAAGGAVRAEETAATSGATQLKIAEALSPSVVRVEYTLRYDEGDAPLSRGWNQRCPRCGNFHGDRVDPIVRDERPLERAGFLLTPTSVVSPHILVHPRFIESIAVTWRGHSIPARPAGYATEHRALLLELDEPIPGAEPLVFGADPEAPLFAASLAESGGQWNIGVQPFAETVLLREDGGARIGLPDGSAIVDAEGRVLGIAMAEEQAMNDQWHGSPADWEQVAAADMERRIEAHAATVEKLLPRVSLHFRSPRESSEDPFQSMYRGFGTDDSSPTEREAHGLLLPDGQILILANLSARDTARLERIRVHLPGQPPASASFVASLSDYGALLARLETPGPALSFAETPAEDPQGRLLLASHLEVRGEQLRAFHEPARVIEMRKGRRGALFPELAGNTADIFLFDLDSNLLALPIEIRERAVGQERRWRSSERVLTPAPLLAAVLADLDAHIDTANVPVDPEEELRLAWIGVELQPLDAGLARAYQVAGRTESGRTGALVTHVYPGSPAEAADIRSGDVLLLVNVEGLPRPFPVQIEEAMHREAFPWDEIDQVPDEYFHFLPQPWSSAENSFTRFLTDLGFGREVEIEGMRDGELLLYTLQIVEGPRHYQAAPEFRSEGFGLTVRELTYETRRFYQAADDGPGVIVARIEPGSPASTAGLKPFELITHIDDEPIFTVDRLQALEEQGGDLRLSVQRMHQLRIVVMRRVAGS